MQDPVPMPSPVPPENPAEVAPKPVRAGGGTNPRRCSVHHGVAAAGTCSVCGRGLCIACAVPVRGVLVGPECLATVVEDVPVVDEPSSPVPARGERLALAGFGLVLVLSLFPWSRFGGLGFFGAWTPHWSLLAVTSALVGFVLGMLARRRAVDPGILVAGYALLGAAIVVGAYLHHHHPPPLTDPTFVDWVAAAGGALVLWGAARKGRAVLRARHWP